MQRDTVEKLEMAQETDGTTSVRIVFQDGSELLHSPNLPATGKAILERQDGELIEYSEF